MNFIHFTVINVVTCACFFALGFCSVRRPTSKSMHISLIFCTNSNKSNKNSVCIASFAEFQRHGEESQFANMKEI